MKERLSVSKTDALSDNIPEVLVCANDNMAIEQ